MRTRLLFSTLLVSLTLNAQDVTGPVAAYIPDPAGSSLQPVLGVRGAAILGDSLPLDSSLSILGISPAQEYLLAADRNSGSLIMLTTGTSIVRAIDGALAGADLVRMSPRGSAAVLRAGSQIQIVSGLPGNPRVQSAVDISASGKVSALAVTDDGALAVAVLGSGTDSALYSISTSGELRWLGALRQDVRIAVSNNGRSAVIAGAATNELWIVDDISGDFSLRRLAGPDQGISGPVGVAFSDDNRRVLVAHAAGVIRVNLQDSSLDSAPCACTPTTLSRIRGNSAFRLTDVSDQPMWVLDGGSDTPGIWFVPPRQATGDGGSH